MREASAEHAGAFDAYRGPLVEGIIEESEDDALMDRYLEGESIEFETLERDLLAAVARGHFYPVLPASAETGAGIGVVAHLIAVGFPHPGMHALPTVTPVDGGAPLTLTADPDGPLVAEVVHTRSDAYLGHLSLVRVFSGTLSAVRPLHVSGHLDRFEAIPGEGHAAHDEDTRPGAIGAPATGDFLPKGSAIAGEVVVVSKLATAQTSDSLSDPTHPLLVTPWALPEALLPTALEPASRADEDRMPSAFRELASEDPALRIEHVQETGQVVVWTTGPAHLDLTLARLKERFNVAVRQVPVAVALRETAIRHASAHTQLAKGLLAGWPVVDVKVTLTDGKAHSVDSSDVAFQTAAGLALRELASPATMTLLEPIDTVRVTVDDDYLGAVMTDVSTRRGQIVGTESADEEGRSVLTASVPQLELLDYAIVLRSLAHGTGTFTRELRGYEPMPERLSRAHLA